MDMFNESVGAIAVNSVQLVADTPTIEPANDIAAAVVERFPNLAAEPDTVLGQAAGFEGSTLVFN